MKKLYKIVLSLLLLCVVFGCTKTEEPVLDENENIEEPEIVVNTGSWKINEEITVIEDETFEAAKEEWTGMNFNPIAKLGTQVVSGEKVAYLVYGTAVVPNAEPSYKIVIVYDNKIEKTITISDVYDFDITKYLDGENTTTPEGMMGGWQDNDEIESSLTEEEKEIFTKALEENVGVGYKPVALLATQVVSGKNYCFLATGKVMSAEPINHLYIINVYQDLEGKISLTNISGLDLSKVSE